MWNYLSDDESEQLRLHNLIKGASPPLFLYFNRVQDNGATMTLRELMTDEIKFYGWCDPMMYPEWDCGKTELDYVEWLSKLSDKDFLYSYRMTKMYIDNLDNIDCNID